MPLQGGRLELHLSRPVRPAPDAADLLVLYASGDGGWFGAAPDMFREIANAGYYTVGFSSRAFLKLERPRGPLVSVSQLVTDYQDILKEAREDLALPPTSPVVLTGWSRGAAFAVLVGSEMRSGSPVDGVLAIGLTSGENLQLAGPDEEDDDGDAGPGNDATAPAGRWPFSPYAAIARMHQPCVVIQATHDNYLPAERARALFGPDQPHRRLYEVDARNHRFSGGKAAFNAALSSGLRWIVQRSHDLTAPGAAEVR